MKIVWRMLLYALMIGLVVLVVTSQVYLTRDPVSQSFPMHKIWKRNVGGKAVAITVVSENIIVVRTGSSLIALDVHDGTINWRHSIAWQGDPKPAVAYDGKIYATDGDVLMALDQKDGSVFWQQKTNYDASWVTDVSDKVVLVNELGVDVLAFDTGTGTLQWTKPVCRGYVQAFVDDEKVYIPCSNLEAIDIASGETEWQAKINSLGHIGYSEGILYYYSSSLQAFDLKSREPLWITSVAHNGLVSFKIIENILFYVDAARLCMLDANNGNLKWCTRSLSPQSPSLIEDRVYIFDGNHKTITALQISDGLEIGTLTLSNFNYFITERQLLTSNGRLLFFADGMDIYAYGN